MTKIGTANVGYWINAVAEGEEDYYSRPGEEPGKWAGTLARELRLEGEVDHDDYMAIFAGQSPRDGESLVRRPAPRRFTDAKGRERKADPVLGFDLRFSAPKSVSLVWAIAKPDVRASVAGAHERAVEAALAYLERNACWVQRGAGGARLERGKGFVGMGFLHRSSRAGDPSLHTHMLISNMTRAVSDGRWLSLAAPKGRMPLWLHAKAAGYIYQAVLRAEITRELGLEWSEVTNGYADLARFDRDLIEHFSQRRAEIIERMAELGLSSAAAAEVAAYRTRAEKEYGVAVDGQRADWIARAAEFSLTPTAIQRMVTAARSRPPAALDREHLDAAIADLEAHHSHFDRRDLICAVACQLREGGAGLEIEHAVDRLLDSERVICVHRGQEEQLAPSYYTTPRLWAMERRIVATAAEGEGAGAARIDAATLERVLARHRYLGDEQVEMVLRLTTGGERVICISARPGTGKTTALLAAREAWAAGGVRGIGVATARSASGELADAGVPSTSIASLLIRTAERAERGLAPLPAEAVIVVDEASAMSTPHAAALLELVERCGGKLVLIGDPRQIGAVGPGGIYGHLTGRVEPIELREIRRQRDPVDREIVRLAHEGRGSDALDLLDASDRLRIADTHPEALDALALDWRRSLAGGHDAVMIARRNSDVEALNERARQFRRERGELGEGIVIAGSEFNVGDRVMTRLNTPEVSNRERWDVIAVDRRKGAITLRRLDENAGAVLTRRYLERRTAEGEPALQHADAITTYAAQSRTFGASFVLLDAGINREDFLVAVSRSRGETVAYGVAAAELIDADLGPAKRETEDRLHELRIGSERVASEYAASEVGDRKAIEALGSVELAHRRVELEARLARLEKPSPGAERLAAIDQRLEAGEARLADLRSRWSEARKAGTSGEELHRLKARGHQGARQLERLAAERSELAAVVDAEPPRTPGTPVERYQLRLVEERIVDLTRREAARERLHPSEMILTTLGPRPDNRSQVLAWNRGVDLIHGFRLRHGITATEGDPLGPRSGQSERRRERRAAEQQLARIQERLSVERQRTAERAVEITM